MVYANRHPLYPPSHSHTPNHIIIIPVHLLQQRPVMSRARPAERARADARRGRAAAVDEDFWKGGSGGGGGAGEGELEGGLEGLIVGRVGSGTVLTSAVPGLVTITALISKGGAMVVGVVLLLVGYELGGGGLLGG
ncbi:hypothetical protein C8A00DRAFT_35273 [Chaetomidium leptoderma]|uniref:Uncharacterized protein n=1 Tax=Chaetomidium leptoderma TaxID=669021 RepID=A0AAN6VIA6_9PEZI|nr:hypothetical protein C8A00DRAFT_35273 [Chaetomidium leptoderma]